MRHHGRSGECHRRRTESVGQRGMKCRFCTGSSQLCASTSNKPHWLPSHMLRRCRHAWRWRLPCSALHSTAGAPLLLKTLLCVFGMEICYRHRRYGCEGKRPPLLRERKNDDDVLRRVASLRRSLLLIFDFHISLFGDIFCRRGGWWL